MEIRDKISIEEFKRFKNEIESHYQIIAKWNAYSGRHKIRIEPLSYCCTVDGDEELWDYNLPRKECEKLLQDYSIKEKKRIRINSGI